MFRLGLGTLPRRLARTKLRMTSGALVSHATRARRGSSVQAPLAQGDSNGKPAEGPTNTKKAYVMQQAATCLPPSRG